MLLVEMGVFVAEPEVVADSDVISKKYNLRDAETIPDGIVPLEFETNDEMIAFLDSLDVLISETSNIDQKYDINHTLRMSSLW